MEFPSSGSSVPIRESRSGKANASGASESLPTVIQQPNPKEAHEVPSPDVPVSVLQTLKRPPKVSRGLVSPMLIGIVLLIVSSVTSQLRIDYLAQHSYSGAAWLIANSTFTPVWEESLKVGLGIIVGAIAAASIVLGTWIGKKRSEDLRSHVRRLWGRTWCWTSVAVFLVVALVFAITEGLGDFNVIKLLGHPGFSILAVLVVLEGKPRAVWFVGLGYGFHSLVNLIVGTLSDRVELIAYLLATFFVVLFDVRILSFWFPSLWGKPVRRAPDRK